MAGSVSRPRTQSASLARSWAAEGGRAGEPGGNCWLIRRILPSPVWISASSSPSSSQLPPGSSLISTRLTSRWAASRRTASSVKLPNPGYASSSAAAAAYSRLNLPASPEVGPVMDQRHDRGFRGAQHDPVDRGGIELRGKLDPASSDRALIGRCSA